MKLKLDENLGRSAAKHLRKFGHDVSTVRLQGLERAPDQVLFGKCVEESRALVTLDRDFGETLRFAPSITRGIAILELEPRPSLQAMLDRLTTFEEMAKIHPLAGALWIVEPGRVRIHLEEDKPVVMVTAKDARKIAMALHGVSEIDHFGRPAFRTAKRIFLVIRPDGLNILLPEERKEFLFAAAPETFVKKMWGKRPYMVAQPEHLSVTELKALIEEAHTFASPPVKKAKAVARRSSTRDGR